MSEEGQGGDVSRDELTKVIGERQAAKGRVRELEEQLTTLRGELKDAAARGQPDAGGMALEPKVAEELTRAILCTAATSVGGFGDQVSNLLMSTRETKLVREEGGAYRVDVVGENGELLTPKEAAGRMLAKRENSNLSVAGSQRYQKQWDEELAVAEEMKAPPENIDDLAKLPINIRTKVLDAMGPAGRARLANPPQQRGFIGEDDDEGDEDNAGNE